MRASSPQACPRHAVHPVHRRHQPRFAEDSRDEDIVLGCQVLADAAASILAAANA